jgi:hypothetical protein
MIRKKRQTMIDKTNKNWILYVIQKKKTQRQKLFCLHTVDTRISNFGAMGC